MNGSMSRSSQRKGADGEKELQALLTESGYPVLRGGSQTYGKVPDLYGLPGIHVECKRVEKLNISAAMQQAVADAARFNDGSPAVFHRRNRQPWLVTMLFTDWLKLYERKDQKA